VQRGNGRPLPPQFSDARRRIFSAATVVELQPDDLNTLIDDCLAHLGEAHAAETVGLRSTRVYFVAQYDIAGGRDTADALERSSDRYVKATGSLWRSHFELRDKPGGAPIVRGVLDRHAVIVVGVDRRSRIGSAFMVNPIPSTTKPVRSVSSS
jgi:hypothetical protein